MDRCTVCRQFVAGGKASADHQRMHSLARNNQQAKRRQKMDRRRGYKVVSSGHKVSVETGEVIALPGQPVQVPGFFSRIWQWLKGCFSRSEVVNAG